MTQRVAARALSIGTVAVVVAALPYKVFELDRYFVPKELVLHLAAFVVRARASTSTPRTRAARCNTSSFGTK